MSDRTTTLTFHGGAGSVTGSNFLIESSGVRLLIDCGLRQGSRFAEQENYSPFPYEPSSISALAVTHAHIDHVGRIPKLVKDGFRGTIHSTAATKDLADIMLRDAVGILAEEARRAKHEPLFDVPDVEHALSQWQTHEYRESFELPGGYTVELRNAGHILGSAEVALSRDGRRIVFTGDIGNSPEPLLPNAEAVTDADYLVMESVYGDRTHEGRDEREQLFRDYVREALKRGGTLLIPAFSVERTQIILFTLNALIEKGELPTVPVFLDSPLAIAATTIYRRHKNLFKDEVRDLMQRDDIFSFPKLSFTASSEESKRIEKTQDPKIIIAGSGMSVGGRVLIHEKRLLPDSRSTVLLMGYQGVGSLGRRIQDGATRVEIEGERVPVRAAVRTIRGYSAHADMDGLFAFAEKAAQKAEKIFVVMGEPRASLFFTQRVREYLEKDVTAPQAGDSVTLAL